jgi:hypothetical protein
MHPVVICGTSVFLAAIEAGMMTLLGKAVVPINPDVPDAVGRIVALSPAVVVFEKSGLRDTLPLALLAQNLTLIELDPHQNHARILSGRVVPVFAGVDLVALIQQLACDETPRLAQPGVSRDAVACVAPK